jgi:hypothetical protein
VLIGDHISGRNDTSDSVPVTEVAVLVDDGMFDSGLAGILDMLDNADAAGREISEPPSWYVATVGFQSQVRTGAGHLVTAEPVAHVEAADLLIVPARAARQPADVLDNVGSEQLGGLLHQAQRQPPDRGDYARPTGPFMPALLGVAPPDQVSVPAQHGVRAQRHTPETSTGHRRARMTSSARTTHTVDNIHRVACNMLHASSSGSGSCRKVAPAGGRVPGDPGRDRRWHPGPG